MKTFRILATAAILSAAGVAPALADWDRIGSVDVSYRQDRDREYTSFGGGIERLQFRAVDSRVDCRFIRATFDNGQTREIFSGRLPRGQAVNVDLPGQSRVVRRLDFSCHADRPRGATVNIFADVGRYRDDWRRSPNWGRMWSHMFNWQADTGNNVNDNNTWITIGTESFEGRNDHETSTQHGWQERGVDRIGLRALDGDARCTRIRASFRKSPPEDLNIGTDVMRRNQMYVIDLAGGERGITRLDLRCHALGDWRVRIEISARK